VRGLRLGFRRRLDVGIPIIRNNSRASPTISRVSFEVIVDFEYAVARSPVRSASSRSSS
jgi:hypothetical protein